MARPRTFSIDDAVEKAMHVFWREGYEGAGLSELCAAMGIVRGSFYKAFGSKRALFLRVLERYDREHVAAGVAMLHEGEGPGERRIAAVFEGGIAAARTGEGRGCLLCNTASGPALVEEGVQEAVARQLDDLTEGFAAALADTERFGTADAATRLAEARRLTLAYVGLRVLGRGGAAPAMLEDAVTRVLAA